VVTKSFSRALFDANVSESEILSRYSKDIDTVLPAQIKDLSAAATNYRTTNIPYPYMPNPTLEQQRGTMGIISKKYIVSDKSADVQIDAQPLFPDLQASTPTKCGVWEANPNLTIFSQGGRPAAFIQTPATGYTPATAILVVCGQNIVVTIQSAADRPREFLEGIMNSLSFGMMETVVGSGK
jgi:hypothetical protein